jgi:hypothetical protein
MKSDQVLSLDAVGNPKGSSQLVHHFLNNVVEKTRRQRDSPAIVADISGWDFSNSMFSLSISPFSA